MTKNCEERQMTLARLFGSGCWALLLLSSYTACVAEDTGLAPATAPVVTTGVPATASSEKPGWGQPESGSGFEPRGYAYHASTQTHDAELIDGRIRLRAVNALSLGGTQRGALVGQVSAAIDLETVAVWRGDLALDVTVLGSELTAPGVVAMVRTDFVETVQDIPDGVEQSWDFAHAPGAAGDLVVAVGTTELDYVGTTNSGVDLRRTGELDVHYSHGVWIDAGGHSWAVPARYDNGRIILTVPADVVGHSTYPAVLDPIIIVTPFPG